MQFAFRFLPSYAIKMKCLGIDYGTKRIGLAISDEEGKIAFPRAILENKEGFIERIVEFIEKEKIERIVIGESVNTKGEDNKIMEEVDALSLVLKNKTGIFVAEEKEFFTSVEARRFQDGGSVDDSAAAIMLQRYLDKQQLPKTNN